MNARRITPERCWLVLALLVALVPGSLAAQHNPERAAIFHLRDSLHAAADTNALLALESQTIDVARKNRDDPMVHLRLGVIGLRLAEITSGAGHFRDAEGEFEWATQLQPKWAMGWYGLGNAELAEADAYPTAMRGLFAALGRDIFVAPALDLAKSAEVDSTFPYGVLELGENALNLGISSHLTGALMALREVAKAPAGRDSAVLMLRGRIEREVGDVDSSIAAFQALLDRNHFNATALLEVARTKLAAGRISGVDQWYLGLSLADAFTTRMYRNDLALVMSDSALRAFDAAKGEARVAVAKRFWDTRDPDAFNGSADRLKEHYRRIEVAHHNYPLVPPGHRYDTLKVFAATGSLFDDRGRIYVRHGEPDDRTSYTMTGIPPNESWVYHRPSGDLLFNFAQPDSAQGFRMYESLLDIVGLGTAAQHTGQGDVGGMLAKGNVLATYGAGWTAQAAQELLYSRQKLSPMYSKMLTAGAQGAREMQLAERAAGRKSIAIGLQTDSWKFGYELPMAADIDVLAVGSDSGGSELQVVFAIPGSSLYARPTTGLVIYPIRMRVAVRNATGDVVKSVDTLRNFGSAAPIAETGNLLGRLPIHVPPGNYSVRVALETESRGLVTKPQEVHVAALASGAIELSDLALGARTVPLPWKTGASDTAWINPLHRFKISEPMQLFFEVGGLAAGAGYKVQYAVLKPGRPDPLIQFGGNAVAAEVPDRVHREIDLGKVGTGDFILQVTVSTPSGTKAVRQRRFTIIR